MVKKEKKFTGNTVVVHGDNWEKAIRTFKKKVLESGLMDDLREREQYDRPSVVKRREKNKQIRRAQRQREKDSLPKKLY